MKRIATACAVLFSLAVLATVQGADNVELKVGDPAPKFSSVDDQGKPWKSEDFVGKKILVVYFYPADCTGGCTKQAQGFRDDLKELAAKGVEVVGVSGDTVENHKVFKKKENLNFTLLADEDGSVAKKFGVPVTVAEGTAKTVIDGKEIVLTRKATAKRWTFVIGKDGKILSRNSEVKAAEDSKAVLKLLSDAK